jgi:hypothetical protein
VWSRYEVPPAETTDSTKEKQSTDGEEDNIQDTTIKAKKAKSKITHVFVPETEEQNSGCEEDNVPFSELKEKRKADRQQEPKESIETVVEKAPTDIDLSAVTEHIGRKVAKQFEDGVYKGEVISTTGKRGRFLYKILYEDGDGEDLNEKEFKKACMLYNEGVTESKEDLEDSDNDKWSYNSDIEVSEYSGTDDESMAPAPKKKKFSDWKRDEKKTTGEIIKRGG